ncbi:MAG TPA: CRISPR system precrRNA processing endoribonuclease RAMP protein Cas6 [Ktedonobacterales bacterium]|jgi:CRISPR-associated endoribonuclease Cas6
MQPIPANPDLFACVLRLTALDEAELERTQGHRAHALFLALMQQADPSLAAALHDAGRSKPFTIATLQTEARRLRPGSSYLLRITLLRGELFGPLARLFLPTERPLLRLGSARFALQDMLVTPGSHPWAGAASWDSLLDGAAPAEELTLHFVTPTAFTQGADANGHKRVGIFPEPAAMFGSLLRRWNDLASTPLPTDLLERVDLLPSSYQLRTEMLQFARSQQVGCVGRCAYLVRGSVADRRLVHALARGAFFLGVGYKTTQGMGLARLDERRAAAVTQAAPDTAEGGQVGAPAS